MSKFCPKASNSLLLISLSILTHHYFPTLTHPLLIIISLSLSLSLCVSYTYHQNLNITLKGGTKQTCAACRFRRMKCLPECVWAPYFPPDQHEAFANVHKVFGVSNLEKMLNNLQPSEKKRAMDAIIGEAYYRDRYPVGGCWEEMCRLQNELSAAQLQLEFCRQHHGSSSSMVNDVTTSQLESTPRNNNAFLPFNHNNLPVIRPETYNSEVSLPAVSDQQSYCNANSTVGYNNSMDVQSKDHVVVAPNSLRAHKQNPCQDGGRCSMAMAMHSQSHLVSSQTGHETKSCGRKLE